MEQPLNRLSETNDAAEVPTIDLGDLVGFNLVDDEHDLGELEELLTLRDQDYYVVDARHWSFGAHKLLPAEAIDLIDPHQRTVTANTDASSIRAAPDFDPFHLHDDAYIDQIEAHYHLDPAE